MFKVVRKPIARVPSFPVQQMPRLPYQPLPKTTWNRFNVLEIKGMHEALQGIDPTHYGRRVAKKFYNNNGGLLTGATGAGKTFLSDMIVGVIA